MKKDLDLRGKDYLTREEAAHYACVLVRQWDARFMKYIDSAGLSKDHASE